MHYICYINGPGALLLLNGDGVGCLHLWNDGQPGDDGALIPGQDQGGAAPGVLLSHRG